MVLKDISIEQHDLISKIENECIMSDGLKIISDETP